MTMFEFGTSMSRPSAYELHLRARHARRQAINGLSRHAVGKFAEWLGLLIYNGGARLARRLAAERRLRRDIRMLSGFQDRDLADIGLGRSEIEYVVRGGRRPRATGTSLNRRTPAQKVESLSA
jgi:uncharacterized protein YjiS (DUF1127 family)